MIGKINRQCKKLRKNSAGVSMLEFALAAPFLIGLGMGGIEMVNFVVFSQRIHYMTNVVASNMSRIGQNDSGLMSNRVKYSKINDLLISVDENTEDWDNVDMMNDGRFIITSIYNNEGTLEKKYQLCYGDRKFKSIYKGQFDAAAGRNTLDIANHDGYVYVEAEYKYKPLFGDMFVKNLVVYADQGYTVRDNRDHTLDIKEDASFVGQDCSSGTDDDSKPEMFWDIWFGTSS